MQRAGCTRTTDSIDLAFCSIHTDQFYRCHSTVCASTFFVDVYSTILVALFVLYYCCNFPDFVTRAKVSPDVELLRISSAASGSCWMRRSIICLQFPFLCGPKVLLYHYKLFRSLLSHNLFIILDVLSVFAWSRLVCAFLNQFPFWMSCVATPLWCSPRLYQTQTDTFSP